MRCRVAFIFCVTGVTIALRAQSPHAIQTKDVVIPKISRKPKIEEFLNGDSRSDMKRIDDFSQRNPGDGVPVSRKTSAWIGYDDKSLFVVFVCDSPPGETRARLAKR